MPKLTKFIAILLTISSFVLALYIGSSMSMWQHSDNKNLDSPYFTDNLNTPDNISKNTHTKLFKLQFSGASGNDLTAQYHTSRNSCRILKGFRQLFCTAKSRWKVHACEKTVLALCICFCYNDLVNYLTWSDSAFAAQLWIFSAIGLSARLWLIQMKKPAAGTNALPLAFYAEGYAQILFCPKLRAAAQAFLTGEPCSHSASRCSAGMRYSGLTW